MNLRMIGAGDAVFGVCLLKQTGSQLIHKLSSLIRQYDPRATKATHHLQRMETM